MTLVRRHYFFNSFCNVSAKVIDNARVKEEDVRQTLDKIDQNNLINVDNLAVKLKEITDAAAAKEEQQQNSVTILENTRTSIFSVIGQTKNTNEPTGNDEDEAFSIEDNITAFLD